MSPLPLTKYRETFSVNKLCMGKQTFLCKFFGRCFTRRRMIRSCKGESKWLRVFKGWAKLVFPLIYPDLGYWYVIWKVNTTNRGLNSKITFCTVYLWGWGFHVKSVFFFKKVIKVPILWCLDYRALLDLCIFRPDPWKSELRCYIQNRKCLGSNPGSPQPWGRINIKRSH